MSKTPTFDKSALPPGLPVIVTGATGGIGAQIARILASLGIPQIIAVRSEAKYNVLLVGLKKEYPDADISFLPLDLNSSHSVTEAVNRLAGRPLAGIINNAATMQRDYSKSPDGPETTLNVNYFNTKLLNLLLLPDIQEGGAVVFTTSLTRLAGHRDHLPETVTPRTFGQLKTYALSKKLITRFAAEFAETARPLGVRVNCCDPGVVDSGMISMHRWFDPIADVLFRPFIRTPQKGAIPAVRALLAPDSGKIYTLRKCLPLSHPAGANS